MIFSEASRSHLHSGSACSAHQHRFWAEFKQLLLRRPAFVLVFLFFLLLVNLIKVLHHGRLGLPLPGRDSAFLTVHSEVSNSMLLFPETPHKGGFLAEHLEFGAKYQHPPQFPNSRRESDVLSREYYSRPKTQQPSSCVIARALREFEWKLQRPLFCYRAIINQWRI